MRCSGVNSEIDSCVALKEGKSVAAPSLKDLLGKTSLAGDLKFKADKCGGVDRVFDVTPFADATRGKINITYRTKELCPSPNLARGLDCVVELNEGKWSNYSCVLSDDDQSTEEDE